MHFVTDAMRQLRKDVMTPVRAFGSPLLGGANRSSNHKVFVGTLLAA